MTVLRDGRLMLRGTFKTYAGRDPSRIDVRLLKDPENPANAGRTLRGIYALKGDELRWCTGTTAASQYPADFVTREGAPYILVVMRRIPAKQD